MTPTSSGEWIVRAVMAPGVVVAGCVVVLLLAWAVAPSSIDGSSLTLSEAAALADQADVVRLLRRGDDPNARQRVRRLVLREIDLQMTPLEAAAAGTTGNRLALMRRLVDAGAVLGRDNYPVLWCLAERRHNGEVMDGLTKLLPGQPAPACSRVRIPW